MVRLFEMWLWLREKGQSLVEYALILVLIAVVVIAILTILGTQVSQVFSRISSTLGGS
ncbi:Flp family type IVb pilin [Thermoflexus sp.]|uniref:Flp family type IVb pilin n=1 Tax=Thermoflexus sp. TaxID=1969742 RepID=UPI002ADD62EB|nr:Flp family type IVb pilin [Thermoflexus sp.]